MKYHDLPTKQIRELAEKCSEIHASGLDFPSPAFKTWDDDYEDAITEALLTIHEKTWSEIRLAEKLEAADRRAEVA